MTKGSKNTPVEQGEIRKRWRGRRSVALIFPDSYALGMANLGFQRVYELLNRKDEIVAERFFIENLSTGRSIESRRHLIEFDIILFSISFELSYLNILSFIEKAGLPLFSEERTNKKNLPLVLSGGVAIQINPCPVIPFMDAFLLGDFEEIVNGLTHYLISDLDREKKGEEKLKRLIETVPGSYVPLLQKGKSIRPVIQRNAIDTVPHSVIVSKDSSFPNTFLLEVTRGCGRGCRFCAAGFIYRPSRRWPKDVIEKTLSDLKGAKKVGLVGLEYASRGQIVEICERLLSTGLKLGFSSLRADALTPEFLELLVRSKNYTTTIAPEAGTERLRRVINKNLTEDQILNAVEAICEKGLRNLKLYFMVGLPFEEKEDLYGIFELSKKIRQIFVSYGRERGKLGKIIVSVSPFVPKPWTPFQWAAFDGLEKINKKITLLKSEFAKLPNVKFSSEQPDKAFIQAILSKGDMETGKDIILKYLKGGKLKKIIKSTQKSAEYYLRKRGEDEIFPWECIRHRIKRVYLFSQWKKAQRALSTSFCNEAKCKRCGACK